MALTVKDLLKKKEEKKSVVQAEEITDAVNDVMGALADKVETEPPKALTPMQKLANTLAKNQSKARKGIQQTPQAASAGKELIGARPDLVVTDDILEQTTPARTNQQMQNPTMEDVSNYVFEEQPEESTLEITNKFDELLESLVTATGNDIPDLLAKNLEFIKEHAFLAEILKPESIGHLCNAMRKSYGHVVQAKNERTKKTSARAKKENAVMDSLASIDFGF